MGFVLTYFLIYENNFQPTDKNFDLTVDKIGNQMLETGENGYALPFEVVSILLLAAMVGCIVIAIKAPPQPSPTRQAINVEGPPDLKIETANEQLNK